MLGGSSVLNYMLYVRGNRRDYDAWEAAGNPGWGYREALRYFRKSEDQRNPYLARTAWHAAGGPLTVQEPPWRTPLAAAFVAAGVEMGYRNMDGNGASQTGFMLAQGTLRRGARCSSAKAFLRPVRHRPNLHIALNTRVLKVLIDGAKRAVGVRLRRQGKVYTVRATREVILSAGAINSPQLLMLSGVGPSAHLQDLGIPLVADLPVGHNLQDHYGTGAITFTTDRPISLMTRRYENLPSILRWGLAGSGPLTTLGGVEALAWLPTRLANRSHDWPDIAFHFVAGSPASDGGQVRRAHRLSDSTWRMFAPLVRTDTWTIIPMLLRPKSRGRVLLRSRDPLQAPLLHAGYFTEEEDLTRLVEGIKIALAVGQTKAMRELGSRLWEGVRMPGCEGTEPWTDAYWGCVCRHYTAPLNHQSGTASMGPLSHPHAVVSPRLTVHGVSSLRVVDASVMPTIVSGNINAPTMMVAEKAADMIKEDWGASKGRGHTRH